MPDSPELRSLKHRVARMREQVEDAGLGDDEQMMRFFKSANRYINSGVYGAPLQNLLSGFDTLLIHRKSADRDKKRR